MTEKNMIKGAGEVTPDVLMEYFRGRNLKSIIVFTVVVHAVVLVGSSIPYLWKNLFGADTSTMSKEVRVENAVREASAALREIATDYGLSPQEISSQFSGGTPSANRVEAPAAEEAPAAAAPPDEPVREKSAIEKELEVKAEGPEMPNLGEDIF